MIYLSNTQDISAYTVTDLLHAKCEKHPRYNMQALPKTKCPTCEFLWIMHSYDDNCAPITKRYARFIYNYTHKIKFSQQTALLIIDMQPKFKTVKPWLIKSVCNLIDETKRLKQPIIIVRYSGFGPVSDCIEKKLIKYKSVYRITKDYDDGSDAIKNLLHTNKILHNIEYFNVCGVNLDACVLETVLGLVDGTKYKACLSLEGINSNNYIGYHPSKKTRIRDRDEAYTEYIYASRKTKLIIKPDV